MYFLGFFIIFFQFRFDLYIFCDLFGLLRKFSTSSNMRSESVVISNFWLISKWYVIENFLKILH